MRAGNKKQAKKSSLMCHCLILPHGPRAAVLLALCPACLPSGCELGSLRRPAALPSWAGCQHRPGSLRPTCISSLSAADFLPFRIGCLVFLINCLIVGMLYVYRKNGSVQIDLNLMIHRHDAFLFSIKQHKTQIQV